MTQALSFDPLSGLSIKAIKGKQGFLFLGGRDSNAVVEFLSGQLSLSRAAYRVHSSNFSALSQLPIPSSLLVVPEAHVIYDNLLPDGIRPTISRPINILRAAFPSKVIYPETELRTARDRGLTVYTGLDSHWSEPCAFAVYHILRAAAGINAPFRQPYEPNIQNEICDLTLPDLSTASALHAKLMARSKPEHLTLRYENGVANHGQIRIFSNPEAPLGRCLVFGTSFSGGNISCYAMDFRETVFCYGTTFDPLLVELVEPDHVFLEQPERFLPFPAAATYGSTLISHALMAASSTNLTHSSVKHSGPLGNLTRILEALTLAELPPTTDLPSAVAKIIESIAQVRRLKLNPIEKNAMRTVLSGAFLREDLMRYLNNFIDRGAFKDAPQLLPETEMGYLGRTRIAVLAQDWPLAKACLFKAAAGFDSSADSRYYEEYLRQR
jgi:hypothetical protein